jgi:2,4-dienoyl-CoA reductase-like NADH-dependent reductase (Old Yellow Enzyme family)
MRPNVHKKIFDVAPIPHFNNHNVIHAQLADLGRECKKKVKKWLAISEITRVKSVGKLRSMAREMLKDELKEIDTLVKKIL